MVPYDYIVNTVNDMTRIDIAAMLNDGRTKRDIYRTVYAQRSMINGMIELAQAYDLITPKQATLLLGLNFAAYGVTLKRVEDDRE